MVTSVAYVATADTTLTLYDPSGYILDQYRVGEPILSVAAPLHLDDLFFAILTS